jgi:hypothetical protein
MVSDVWDVVNVNRDIRECVICGDAEGFSV